MTLQALNVLNGLGLKLVIRNETRQCESHGEYLTPLVIDSGGRERGGGCPVCREADQRKEWLALMRGQQAQDLKKPVGVPHRFTDAMFSTFKIRNESQRRVVVQAQEFVEHFADRLIDGGCLTLLGTIGTGKTRLGSSIANALALGGYKVRFTKVADMVDHIRESWMNTATRTTRAIISDYVAPDLLIIDELAVSKDATANEKNLLFRVIDGRYEECRPTILISNQEMASFSSAVGDRVIDRLIERGELLTFSWASERLIVTSEPPQAQLSLVAAK